MSLLSMPFRNRIRSVPVTRIKVRKARSMRPTLSRTARCSSIGSRYRTRSSHPLSARGIAQRERWRLSRGLRCAMVCRPRFLCLSAQVFPQEGGKVAGEGLFGHDLIAEAMERCRLLPGGMGGKGQEWNGGSLDLPPQLHQELFEARALCGQVHDQQGRGELLGLSDEIIGGGRARWGMAQDFLRSRDF